MLKNVNSPKAAVPVLVTVYDTENKLTFTINRGVQFNTISRDGKNVNRPDQASNTVNIIEEDGQIVGTVDNEGEVLYEYGGETLLSMLSKFIRCSDTKKYGCLGGNGKFAEPLEPNTVTKKKTSAKISQPANFPKFNDFPQEIKDMILSQAVEPHTVTVYRGSDCFIVAMDRKWADIALYQVCRKFRQYAIKKFGIPKQHKSFPFDPANDTLYLRTYSNHRLGQLQSKVRKDTCKRPMFEIHHGDIERDTIDHEVWDRVQTVETEARMPQDFGAQAMGGDQRMFRNIQTWRILMVQLDTCKIDYNPDTQSLYQKSDHDIMVGVFNCLSGKTRKQPNWKPKFIEVYRTGYMCSNVEKL